jgi:hypothetical protein
VLVQEYVVWTMGPSYDVFDQAWLAGAKAGIAQREHGAGDAEWADFIEGLRLMMERLPEVEPAEPGTAPAEGSLYEALGGYVSLAGELEADGLSFSVPLIRQRMVLSLFPAMNIIAGRGRVVIPHGELPRFNKLVPIRGPLQERIGVFCGD